MDILDPMETPSLKLDSLDEYFESTNPYVRNFHDDICGQMRYYARHWWRESERFTQNKFQETIRKFKDADATFCQQTEALADVHQRLEDPDPDEDFNFCYQGQDPSCASGLAMKHACDLIYLAPHLFNTGNSYPARFGMTAEETRKEDVAACRERMREASEYYCRLGSDVSRLTLLLECMMYLRYHNKTRPSLSDKEAGNRQTVRVQDGPEEQTDEDGDGDEGTVADEAEAAVAFDRLFLESDTTTGA